MSEDGAEQAEVQSEVEADADAEAVGDEGPEPVSEDKPGSQGAVEQRVLARVVAEMGGQPRSGQQQMVRECCAAIDAPEHLMIQAGTGTGKSIGYLVPVMTRSAREGKKVLVSTGTLNLQRQILVKDAPAVARAVREECGNEPEVAVLKGWSNYLCIAKTGGASAEAPLFDLSEPIARPSSDLGREVLRAREWAAETETGDRDDLVPGITDRAWRQVSIDKRECPGRHCPMFEECFAQAAREHAMAADVIVTNHSLLGIQATGSTEVIPEVDIVVVDEAHDLADRVRSQATHDLTAGQMARIVKTLHSRGGIDTEKLEKATDQVEVVLSGLDDGLIVDRPENLLQAMVVLDDGVRQMRTLMKDSSAENADRQLAMGTLDELGDVLTAWDKPQEQSIAWISRAEPGASPVLHIAPLDVAFPIGAHALGDRPAILTSATLTVGGSFDLMAQRLGLAISDLPWRGITVESPFDTARQGIRYIASQLQAPGPGGPGDDAIDEMVDLVQASGGGALVLFSSWRGVNAGAEALRDRTDLEVLVQGETTTSDLINRFRDDRDSVLVGTLGLWQGIDVSGPTCRLVVIDRIPFPHVNDPITRALDRDATRRRQSGFMTVSLPHAALLMAQGAGRLLRSTEDRGMVAILDSRLVHKGYGAYVLNSMQPMWQTTDPAQARAALSRLHDALDSEAPAEGTGTSPEGASSIEMTEDDPVET